MPSIIASTLAITMSSRAALADITFPSLSSTFIITSAMASDPPVRASNRYSFNRTFTKLPVSFCIALIAASTGPKPVSAATYSFPSNTNFTEAVGMTLIPVTTAKSTRSTIFSSLTTLPITDRVIASKSASVTILPLSPSFLTLLTMSFNCSLLGCIPTSSSSVLMPRVPACLPGTNLLLLPTSSGLIGSKVEGTTATPRVWMPDSWTKAFSPTIALFG